LNTHNAYKDFREARAKQREDIDTIEGLVLVKHLKNYASIGDQYVKLLKDIIVNNSLSDFDKSILLPTTAQGLAL
jgi:Bax protein